MNCVSIQGLVQNGNRGMEVVRIKSFYQPNHHPGQFLQIRSCLPHIRLPNVWHPCSAFGGCRLVGLWRQRRPLTGQPGQRERQFVCRSWKYPCAFTSTCIYSIPHPVPYSVIIPYERGRNIPSRIWFTYDGLDLSLSPYTPFDVDGKLTRNRKRTSRGFGVQFWQERILPNFFFNTLLCVV